uniref:Neutral ceramidase n=1 Tax=Bovicola ovis TaxID=186214 RepID=E1ABV0_9NEOP|nr:putative ceramidase [Bovicola ovis]
MNSLKILVLAILVALFDIGCAYQIGIGRADVTGPITEITLMGYGKFTQKGSGIHTRQHAKSFIIDDGKSRLVFISVDLGMMGDGVRIHAIKVLEEKFKGLYNHDNVIMSGTHTHSGVGGFLFHTMFDVPSGGFCKETFHALVQGIVKSVEKAHNNLQEGKLFLATTTRTDISINRSPSSYLFNPEAERKRYSGDTDKEMVQLRFENKNGEPIGVINWYAIHATTMNNTNTLVSSDNVGIAGLMLEQLMEKDSLQGQAKFVAAFASSNLGDVSPNTDGPKCHQSGTECTPVSRCDDFWEECYALGPGKNGDMFESAEIIGTKMSTAALELIKKKAGVEVTGPINAIHQYVDMSKAKAEIFNNSTGKTETITGCYPAMGYAAGSGTTDGQFLPFLHQGMKENIWWVDAITHVLATPTPEDIACHAPKPILLATGRIDFPFEWQPKIVSTQLGRIGNLAIACVPGEFTTMSGRRMREAMKEVFGQNMNVVIAGLCNTYSDYITTFEEYQAQRYEAGSTLYGPHTLNLHLIHYKKLAKAILENTKLERGPEPAGLDPDSMFSTIPPVLFDGVPENRTYGEVLVQPKNILKNDGSETVFATFVGANPRNNLRLDDTFFVIEKEVGAGQWKIVATDADYKTKLHWKRTDFLHGYSEVNIEWTPVGAEVNKNYRIRYFGDQKNTEGIIKPFEGVTKPFKITGASAKTKPIKKFFFFDTKRQ